MPSIHQEHCSNQIKNARCSQWSIVTRLETVCFGVRCDGEYSAPVGRPVRTEGRKVEDKMGIAYTAEQNPKLGNLIDPKDHILVAIMVASHFAARTAVPVVS